MAFNNTKAILKKIKSDKPKLEKILTHYKDYSSTIWMRLLAVGFLAEFFTAENPQPQALILFLYSIPVMPISLPYYALTEGTTPYRVKPIKKFLALLDKLENCLNYMDDDEKEENFHSQLQAIKAKINTNADGKKGGISDSYHLLIDIVDDYLKIAYAINCHYALIDNLAPQEDDNDDSISPGNRYFICREVFKFLPSRYHYSVSANQEGDESEYTPLLQL